MRGGPADPSIIPLRRVGHTAALAARAAHHNPVSHVRDIASRPDAEDRTGAAAPGATRGFRPRRDLVQNLPVLTFGEAGHRALNGLLCDGVYKR